MFGEMIQFDVYFSNGLKQPTSLHHTKLTRQMSQTGLLKMNGLEPENASWPEGESPAPHRQVKLINN